MKIDKAAVAEAGLLRAITLCEEHAANAEAQKIIAREMGLDMAFAAWGGVAAASLSLKMSLRGILEEMRGDGEFQQWEPAPGTEPLPEPPK